MKRKLTTKKSYVLKDWTSQLDDLLRKISSRNLLINLGDSSSSLTESDCIRAVSESFAESAIKNLILNCLVDAESRSAGSSYVALSSIAGRSFPVVSQGKRFSISDIERSLRKLSCDLTSSIVIDAIKISGRQGKILFDASDVQTTEITYGTRICKWKPDQKFFESLRQHKVSMQSCKVVFVDGIIESVSECHRLFNDSYDLKIPIVIFARGYADEVNFTAAVNIQRQTAQVLPIVIPFDEVGVNGMGDLASCFGSEVISSDKGQLISNINVSECVSVERISCSPSGTEIEFASDRVDSVVKRISDRLHECEPHQSDLLRRRINALGTNSVTIKLGHDKKSISGIYRDRVDFGIRYVRSCMQQGMIEHDGLMLPFKSVKCGLDCANSFFKIVHQNGAILEVDRCG